MINTEGFFVTKNGKPEDAFELRPFELKDPNADEVLIEVEAFGLNYADVMARNGLYREAPPIPFIPGLEVVGMIKSVGANVDRDLIGKRVLAFCRFGAYARHVVTLSYAAIPVGDQPAEELLSLSTQGVTAYYMAEYLTPIHKIDTVLIHAAAGGVGTILIQLAKRKGATVIAKVGQDDKIDAVKKLGADYAINYRKEDYVVAVQKCMNNERIDLTFNPVAGATFKKDMSLIGSGGRVVLFGVSSLADGKWGFFSKLNFVRKMGFVIPIGLMARSKNILGVNMMKIGENRPDIIRTCMEEVFTLYRNGELHPVIDTVYPSTKIHEAHEKLERGLSIGKIAIRWE